MEVLDELDICFGDANSGDSADETGLYGRARAIRNRLEAANDAIYEAIRSEIQLIGIQREQGARPGMLLRWIEICRDRKETPPRGLSYDDLDELISGVLQLREPDNAPVHRGPEEVFYQPTPVRHILHLIEASGLNEADCLVDLGSGLGHVTVLASILAGARSIGIEAEATYVGSAQECANSLGLKRIAFVQQDARDADLSAGTVFYLYTPFTGTLLRTVLDKLRRESERRDIRVCTFGPCSLVAAREPWLRTNVSLTTDQIVCFRSGG
ncbi:MAG: class I SAM-dependent methyltransferase [Terracidiphilus sp.]